MEKTVIELFAGVGGFRIGLNNIREFKTDGRAIENRDWNFVWANQWEPSTKIQHAFDCYETRFGKSENHVNVDISVFPKEQIPNHNLLVGGFPCQDYSVARSISGEKGIEGKKGVLFWEIADILKAKETPFILLENVDRLLKSPAIQRGRDFGIMLRTFHNLGYNVEWRVINASDYGCAQKRRRIFIFAWRRNLNYNHDKTEANVENILYNTSLFAQSFPIDIEASSIHHFRKYSLLEQHDTVEMTKDFKANFGNFGLMIDGFAYTQKYIPLFQNRLLTLGDILEHRKHLNSYFLTDKQIQKFKYLKGAKKVPRIKPDGSDYNYSEGSMCFPDNLKVPGRTMLTSEASVNRSTHVVEDYETHELRFLTPVEAERLQHFPDNWTATGMPERRRYFMMGNALVAKIINILESKLASILEEE